MFPRDQSPVSDIDTASGLSCSSEQSTAKTRKSVPKRLRLGSEASSPGPEEEDTGDKKEIEVRKLLSFYISWSYFRTIRIRPFYLCKYNFS